MNDALPRFHAEDDGEQAVVYDRSHVLGGAGGVIARCRDMIVAVVIANRLNNMPPAIVDVMK